MLCDRLAHILRCRVSQGIRTQHVCSPDPCSAITLRDELLLPLSESLLLDLDLLGESLLRRALFLFLELGVVQLSWSSLAELAGLHLLGAVCLVVRFFGGVDEIQHVGSNQDGAELLEVAVVLVLNLCNTPRVLATLDDAPVAVS